MAPAPESSSVGSQQWSILITALILSVTVFVSVSLCLLLRYLRRQNQNRRVSPAVLPVSSVKSSGGDCSVCLSSFESSDQLRLLPLCCHAFHAECIDAWLRTNQTCPLCRSPINSSDSFRLQIGSVSRRQPDVDHNHRSYSIGSFPEVVVSQTHHPSGSVKESAGVDLQDLEASRVLGEEIAEIFRWFSGVPLSSRASQDVDLSVDLSIAKEIDF